MDLRYILALATLLAGLLCGARIVSVVNRTRRRNAVGVA